MKKPFDRIITIMFENQYRSYAIQNPFLKKLASAGADMTNYFGAFHPSQTNYLASLSGEICGVTTDTPPASPLMQETLVDLLEEKNVSWKAYMEAYPNEPWNPAWKNPKYSEQQQPINQFPAAGAKELSRYYRKHNSFASFHNVQKEEARWNKIVSDTEFWNDVANDSLPEYSWFTPDIWNDGHYLYNTHIDTNPRTQLIPQLSAWLEYVFLGDIDTTNIQGGSETGLKKLGLNLDVDLLLSDPKKAWENSNVPKGTLIVVTFDEADFNAEVFDTNYDGPNQIYTVLLGDMIEPGTVVSTPYNHYNLIRTVEQNYQLGSLKKNDHNANWFRFLWNESFAWNTPVNTGFAVGNTLAIANETAGEHMVFSNANGQLFDSILSASSWSQPNKLDIVTQGAIAMASINNKITLITVGADGVLMSTAYDTVKKQWSETSSLKQKTAGSIALTTYLDMATYTNKLMLCWVSADGFIQSMDGDVNGFSGTVTPVNQLTDGAMTLGQVGASLFLVYKERNTRKMRITSYNTAPFNAFDAINFNGNPAPESNTTFGKWSVTDFTVGHFSKKMAALADEYENLGHMAMATLSGEMHLVHRGSSIYLSNAYTEIFGLTGIYSAANELSNGYGTLDQAGWTREEEMTDVVINPNSPVAMCSNEETFTLIWADANSKTIKYKQGEYATI
ncbi:alkaline phosphatase family protein [Flavivirga jejuensis]|uniref:Alkaline phosphatase family protein n=1 Tax=Flavivirga jejuensis TaxID=870487 RepID=A0ABT8WPS1_9FLAO|nr:alkaline phosphatase family protein [Flavivirga jejuensis]MDO5975128.1 alkaline phosphatase family protein [Flavivirga jejuensis]